MITFGRVTVNLQHFQCTNGSCIGSVCCNAPLVTELKRIRINAHEVTENIHLRTTSISRTLFGFFSFSGTSVSFSKRRDTGAAQKTRIGLTNFRTTILGNRIGQLCRIHRSRPGDSTGFISWSWPLIHHFSTQLPRSRDCWSPPCTPHSEEENDKSKNHFYRPVRSQVLKKICGRMVAWERFTSLDPSSTDFFRFFMKSFSQKALEVTYNSVWNVYPGKSNFYLRTVISDCLLIGFIRETETLRKNWNNQFETQVTIDENRSI